MVGAAEETGYEESRALERKHGLWDSLAEKGKVNLGATGTGENGTVFLFT